MLWTSIRLNAPNILVTIQSQPQCLIEAILFSAIAFLLGIALLTTTSSWVSAGLSTVFCLASTTASPLSTSLGLCTGQGEGDDDGGAVSFVSANYCCEDSEEAGFYYCESLHSDLASRPDASDFFILSDRAPCEHSTTLSRDLSETENVEVGNESPPQEPGIEDCELSYSSEGSSEGSDHVDAEDESDIESQRKEPNTQVSNMVEYVAARYECFKRAAIAGQLLVVHPEASRRMAPETATLPDGDLVAFLSLALARGKTAGFGCRPRGK